EVRKSLTVLLREAHDDPVTAAQRAESFAVMADKRKCDLSRQQVVVENDEIVFSCFLMPHEGGCAFVFLSDPGSLSSSSLIQAEKVFHDLVVRASQEFRFLQLMIEPEDAGRIAFARQAGFVFGSEMNYMYRQINARVGVVRIPPRVNWQIYSERNHELFAKVVEKTWQDSCDCSFLGECRSAEESLASYKASAICFDRTYWSLMLIDKVPAGLCLLSPLISNDNIELTYTGVVPEFRGKGLGKVMLNRALSLCAIDGFRVMTLAVDTKNSYARNIYVNSGFKDMFTRMAFFYVAEKSSAKKETGISNTINLIDLI
ncbi:MAG: GNAT family N-acetyltransferase, partial [Sedimentisphaerales bacterium]|nr:GNAT family N-acetyltransferase [Sedimentisphaerales bacterium]